MEGYLKTTPTTGRFLLMPQAREVLFRGKMLTMPVRIEQEERASRGRLPARGRRSVWRCARRGRRIAAPPRRPGVCRVLGCDAHGYGAPRPAHDGGFSEVSGVGQTKAGSTARRFWRRSRRTRGRSNGDLSAEGRTGVSVPFIGVKPENGTPVLRLYFVSTLEINRPVQHAQVIRLKRHMAVLLHVEHHACPVGVDVAVLLDEDVVENVMDVTPSSPVSTIVEYGSVLWYVRCSPFVLEMEAVAHAAAVEPLL